MNVPFVDLRAQYRSIRNEVLANIQQVLEKCNFVLGEEVRQFEEEFQRIFGAARNAETPLAAVPRRR